MANTTFLPAAAELELSKLELFLVLPNKDSETLLVNNIFKLQNTWPNGYATNIDEPLSVADGQYIGTSAPDEAVTMHFTDPVRFRTVDTIESVAVIVRARESNATNAGFLEVKLRINNVSQGVQETEILEDEWRNDYLTSAGWNQQWTKEEIENLSLVITSKEASSPNEYGYRIDTVEIHVIFVPLLGLGAACGASALAVEGKTPTVTVANAFKQMTPAVGVTSLLGYTPVLNNTIAVSSTALTFAGKTSYRGESITTATLVPVSHLGSSQSSPYTHLWYIYSYTNVDELYTAPDSTYISSYYNLPTGPGLFVKYGIGSPGLTDTDEILEIRVLYKGNINYGSGGSPAVSGEQFMKFSLGFNGATPIASNGFLDLVDTPHETEFTATWLDEAWNSDWSADQINNMAILFEYYHLDDDSVANENKIALDYINVQIDYIAQSPTLILVTATELALSTTQPTLSFEYNISVPNNALTFAGKVFTFSYTATLYPSERALNFTELSVKAFAESFISIGVATLTISNKVLTIEDSYTKAPAAKTALLNGQSLSITAPDNHFAAPLKATKTLTSFNPLRQTVNADLAAPDRDELAFTGNAPTILRNVSFWINVAAAAITTAEKTALVVQGQIRPIAKASLALTSVATVDSSNTNYSVSNIAAAFTGNYPQLGFASSMTTAAASLASYAPTYVEHIKRSPNAASLLLTTYNIGGDYDYLVTPAAATLTIQRNQSAVAFSTGLSSGRPGIINLTVDYDIEFIATPTSI